jgi:hypothetical protein
MISALIATRGRVESLRKAVRSLRGTAGVPIEVLLAIDDDDMDTLRSTLSLDFDKAIIVKRYGYDNLHEYYNELARIATGDWLLLYNDDCTITTQGWGIEVEEYVSTRPSYLCGTTSGSAYPCFPLISRAAYTTMGKYSEFAANDTWLVEIFKRVWPDDMHTIDMHIDHTPKVSLGMTNERMKPWEARFDGFAAELRRGGAQ